VRDFSQERLAMAEEQLRRRGISDARVLEAMAKVPRHLFVPENYRTSAYEDRPLPIGEGQTISQPYMVAVMTQSLDLKGEERVLEIGTGSGYQAAILSLLCRKVYTVVRIAALMERAPFDGIIVTAGAPETPKILQSQLAEGGRLVIPTGPRYAQTLYQVTRKGDHFIEEDITGCVFVPLVGDFGWKDE
jgi:protein-L-isoaspartate(D-aspartate) O-methyltransferase